MVDQHAVAHVFQRDSTGGIGADVIPFHQVCGNSPVARRIIGEMDAERAVARDDVAGSGRSSTDRVIVRAIDPHSAAGVGQGGFAAGFGADIVSRDQVTR